MSNMKSARFMTAKHDGEIKTLSMCAWSRLLGVTEYFIRNKKVSAKLTDQQIIDAAIKSSVGISSADKIRRTVLHNMAIR